MSDKIFGDLEIFGVVTVGSGAPSGSYTLPYNKGNDGSILGIAPAPSSTGLSGTMVQWLDPYSSPFNFVTSAQLNSLTNSTSAATLCAANQFTLNNIINVEITGQGGITVTEVSTNHFIIALYVPLTASLSVIPSTQECGQSITAAALSWSYNKSIISQNLDNGIGSLSAALRAYNYTTVVPITSSRSFSITGNDGTQNAYSTATVSFYSKRYWGTVPSSGSLPSNAELLAGSGELTSTRVKTITYNCSTPSGGNYFYYCYPKSFGLATITINNLSFSDWYDPLNPLVATTTPATISVTGQYGAVKDYYMYRNFVAQYGASIPVVYT